MKKIIMLLFISTMSLNSIYAQEVIQEKNDSVAQLKKAIKDGSLKDVKKIVESNPTILIEANKNGRLLKLAAKKSDIADMWADFPYQDNYMNRVDESRTRWEIERYISTELKDIR